MPKYYVEITLRDIIMIEADSKEQLSEKISDNEDAIAEQLSAEGKLGYSIFREEDK